MCIAVTMFALVVVPAGTPVVNTLGAALPVYPAAVAAAQYAPGTAPPGVAGAAAAVRKPNGPAAGSSSSSSGSTSGGSSSSPLSSSVAVIAGTE